MKKDAHLTILYSCVRCGDREAYPFLLIPREEMEDWMNWDYKQWIRLTSAELRKSFQPSKWVLSFLTQTLPFDCHQLILKEAKFVFSTFSSIPSLPEVFSYCLRFYFCEKSLYWIDFIYHVIHPDKVYNSGIFSISTDACNYHHDLILNHFCVLSHFSRVLLLATLWTVTHQGCSVHGILQARILEWVTIPSSRGSSLPRDQTPGSCFTGRFLTTEPSGKPWNIFVSLKRNLMPVTLYHSPFHTQS